MNKLSRIILAYGFPIVLLLLVIIMSFVTDRFLTFSNIFGILHSAVPLLILGCGIAFVIMMAELDLSIGSLAFLCAAISSVLIERYEVSQVIALPLILIIGAVAGLINGLVIIKLKVSSIIATMGAMFIFRGLALMITGSQVVPLPSNLSTFGNFRVGPIFLDIIIGGTILFLVYLLHQWTGFGRRIMAIGNSHAIAAKVGIKVDWYIITAFILSGVFAALASFFSMAQLGSVSLTMGVGWEFSAIGALVIGGISLFGGEGSIIPGLLLGGITLILFENALNHLGASPFLYPFVRGGLIFIAMYADSLKRKLRPEIQSMA